MTDPLEHTEQQREAIAAALEELEAAANAWRYKRTSHNTDLIEQAIDALRDARKPKPTLMQRLDGLHDQLCYRLNFINHLRNLIRDNGQPTPEQLAQIERWEREMEGTK